MKKTNNLQSSLAAERSYSMANKARKVNLSYVETVELAMREEERTRAIERENQWAIPDDKLQAAKTKCAELIDKASVPCDDVWKIIYDMLCPRRLPPGATSVMRHCRAKMQKKAFYATTSIIDDKLDSIIAVDGPFAADYEPAIEQNKKLMEIRQKHAELAYEDKLAKKSAELVAQSRREN